MNSTDQPLPLGPLWRKLSMDEMREIWDAQKEAGDHYNGMDADYLVGKYGADSVRHEWGIGWFVLTEAVA